MSAVSYGGAIVPWANWYPGGYDLNVDLQNTIANDYGVVALHYRPGSAPTTPTLSDTSGGTWERLLEASGGSGSEGAGTGTSKVIYYGKKLAGGETRVVLPNPGNISGLTWAFRASGLAGGEDWLPLGTAGADSTHDTSFSSTGAANLGLQAGDLLVATKGTDGQGSSIAAPTLSAPGCTIGSVTSRLIQPTGNGNQAHMQIVTAPITAGASTGPPTLSGTLGAAGCGVAGFLRLRAASPAPAGSTMKVWNGTAWVNKPLMRWSGSAWTPVEPARLKRWDGSSWVAL